jgi:S-adenosylmethionine:tRNA ribosyltransferase-isomerase
MPLFHTRDFDFALPPELIAQHPEPERSGARLLDGRIWPPTDRVFRDLPELLDLADLLVFNDTRVVKARMFGAKPTGGRIELLVERVLDGHDIAAHLRVSKKPVPGMVLPMAGGFTATLLSRWPDEDGALFRLRLSDDPYVLMERYGHVPLPPYIKRHHDRDATISHASGAADAERYQTVFARNPGAVAAPTAALHFDAALLAALDARGIRRTAITLHVGAGTFQPVKTEDLSGHVMHRERYVVPEVAQAAIADCRARGGRVVAVGTTTVRTLESWAHSGQASGDTDIFITPGFGFRVVDVLITNFHLPRSTLMMLVSAFARYEHVMALYRHAIERRYRFFSYGDAMLLTRAM